MQDNRADGTQQKGGRAMKKIGLRNIIDRCLVAIIVLVIAAAISFTGGTVLAISHVRPFHHCIICNASDTGSCEKMVAFDQQQ